jgi:hypothetical protein
MMRLNKYLAHAGVGSRRHCEDLILRGRVTIDGNKVRELGNGVRTAELAAGVKDFRNAGVGVRLRLRPHFHTGQATARVYPTRSLP